MHGNPARDLNGSVCWWGVVIILLVIILFMIIRVLVLLVLAILGGRSGVRIRVGNSHARPAKNGNSSSGSSDQFAHQDFLMVNAKVRRLQRWC